MKIHRLLFLLFITSLFSCSTKENMVKKEQAQSSISVEYPEAYELANIVLALTDYGISDPYQVRKDFDYYDNMRSYFSPFMDHPLLDSVNCSREKWKEYLSYRTDSYAFQLDDDYKLNRTNELQSFENRTFDHFKELTEDFAKKTKFKEFFAANQDYYTSIITGYSNEYMLKEMKQFLSSQFDDYFKNKKYSVVISPFVYAQHLHRDIDSTWTADFGPVAMEIINNTGFEKAEDKSTQIHTLFTEMDHGYVNPTSDKYDILTHFADSIWNHAGGYGGVNVFNEYMTWAVFDIFNDQYFPESSDKVNLNWHFQNDTRGFVYSNLFGTKLSELYNSYKGEKTIAELYPEMLTWAKETQSNLSKPKLKNTGEEIHAKNSKTSITLEFSEPMIGSEKFDAVLQFSQWDREVVTIGQDHNLTWSDDNKTASFEIELPQKGEYYLLFNWWGAEHPLLAQTGITLQATSGFKIVANAS